MQKIPEQPNYYLDSLQADLAILESLPLARPTDRDLAKQLAAWFAREMSKPAVDHEFSEDVLLRASTELQKEILAHYQPLASIKEAGENEVR